MNSAQLQTWLSEVQVNPILINRIPPLLAELPAGNSFGDDNWDVINWLTRGVAQRRSSNLSFSKIAHIELREMGKLWVLDGRLKSKNGEASAIWKIIAFTQLAEVLGARPLRTLKTGDFYGAENLLREKFGPGTAYRASGYLESASFWLGISLGLALDYQSRLKNPVVHGRYGVDEGKASKLVPDSVFRDLIAARHRDSLITKDAFFLNVLAIQMATGFRISELATLPVDCLLREGGHLQVLHYPAKGGRPIPRPIHPSMKDVVEHAVETLTELTVEARVVARAVRFGARLDWSAIYGNAEALRYFVAKWAHELTSEPNHLMVNPNGAWHNGRQCFIDAIGALEAANGFKTQASRNLQVDRNTFDQLLAAQAAARGGELPVIANSKNKGKKRTNWDTDVRLISFVKLEKHTSILMKKSSREVIRDILVDAQQAQLAGSAYPAPEYKPDLEELFRFEWRPLTKDKDGKPVIYPDKALLVTQKFALSEHFRTKVDEFVVVNEKIFAKWLAGEARLRGTGKPGDSVFSRLEIIDPRTGELVKFTSHDVRHWLNTIYQNGGLTEDQIALIFNRKHKKQNAVYDQTSNRERSERMKQAIRDKISVGTVTDTYAKLSEFSRDDAEEYLEAVVRMVNPMPHGVCTLDWSTTPCPHHLSCFSCKDDGPCEHLNVDPRNDDHVHEMKKLAKESDLVVNAIKAQGIKESPQIDHFKKVRTNVNQMLNRIPAINVV